MLRSLGAKHSENERTVFLPLPLRLLYNFQPLKGVLTVVGSQNLLQDLHQNAVHVSERDAVELIGK